MTQPAADLQPDQIPALPLPRAVLLYRAELAERGLKSIRPLAEGGQRLGAGRYGAAFRVDTPAGPRALKLTTDVNEAMAAYLLCGRAFRRLPAVHAVHRMPRTMGPGKGEWFVIERELLEPLSASDTDLLHLLGDLYVEERLELPHTPGELGRWHAALRYARPDADGLVLKRGLKLISIVAQAVQDMKTAVGLVWTDIHGENFMRRAAGGIVISDLGPCGGHWLVEGRSLDVPRL